MNDIPSQEGFLFTRGQFRKELQLSGRISAVGSVAGYVESFRPIESRGDRREYQASYPRAPLPLGQCTPDSMHHWELPAFHNSYQDDCGDVSMHICIAALLYPLLSAIRILQDQPSITLPHSWEIDWCLSLVGNNFQKRPVGPAVVVTFRIFSCAHRTCFLGLFDIFFHGLFPQ